LKRVIDDCFKRVISPIDIIISIEKAIKDWEQLEFARLCI